MMLLRVLVAVGVVLLALALAALGGCARQHRTVVEIQEVRVPVAVMPEAPEDLVGQYRPAVVPRWLDPADPGATSALDEDGERALRRMLIELMVRDAAWRRWAVQE